MAKPKRASAGKRKSKQRSAKAQPRIAIGGLRNTLSGYWGLPPPAGLRESSFIPDTERRVGLPTNIYSQQVDVAASPADIARRTIEQAPRREPNVGVVGLPPAGDTISSFTPDAERRAGLPTTIYTPAETAIQQAAQRPVRPSVPPPNAAMASPETRMGPTSGLPGLSDYERSQLAQADARISPQQREAIRQAKEATISQPAAEKNARLDIGGIRAPTSPQKQTERLQPTTPTGAPTEVAAAQPDRLAGTSVPDTGLRTVAPVETASLTGAMVDARHPAAPAGIARSLADPDATQIAADDPGEIDIAAAADEAGNALDDNTAGVDPETSEVNTGVPTVDAAADAAADDAVDDAYPEAPAQIAAPKKSIVRDVLKDATIGGVTAGIPGAVLGGANSLVQGLLARGPGFDAVVPDRFSTGTGLRGINAALGGLKGAQGFSLSNPGMSVTATGRAGQSLRRSDRFGWTEVVGPDGSVQGIRYDNPDKKGLLGRVSNYFDSRYGGQRSMSSISPGAARAIGAGRGGLY